MNEINRQAVRIALDAMGGDHAPAAPVKGALDALKINPQMKIYLVGKPEVLKKELSGYSYSGDRIEIVPASEVIETAEPPVQAIRTKKDSSLVIAMQMVRDGKAEALVSSGNTGAVLAGGTMIVRRLKGIHRAPLAALIPSAKGPVLLLDAGANVDVRPAHLIQFAHLGSIYMESVFGRKDPKVAMVNIGEEEEKGNALARETYPLLKEETGIRFSGNIEARDIPAGRADVIVAEGFVGNVILKMYEGVGKVMIGTLKKVLKSSMRSRLGALLAYPALKKELKQFDVSEYGGAPLLGLNGLVVKTHGSSGDVEFCNTLIQCCTFVQQDINGRIRSFLAEKS